MIELDRSGVKVISRGSELVEEIGEAEYLKILDKEYVLQEEESNLPTPFEIFEVFESKFTVFLNLFGYAPIFGYALKKGFDILKKNNYSAFEIRLVFGISNLIGEDFKVWDTERNINFIHKLTSGWSQKNEDISKCFY